MHTQIIYTSIIAYFVLYPTLITLITLSHEITTHAYFLQNELAAVFMIMAAMTSSERAKEDNHVLSSSSNTISGIEGSDLIQRDGALG